MNKLFEAIEQERPYCPDNDYDIGYNNGLVMAQAIVLKRDVVEVVRCKDCIHLDGSHYIGGEATGKVYCYGYCYHWDYEPGMSPNQVDGDDFCSYGKKREV